MMKEFLKRIQRSFQMIMGEISIEEIKENEEMKRRMQNVHWLFVRHGL